MTPRKKGTLAGAALLLALAGTTAGIGGGAASARPGPVATGDGRLVLVSGRDDHGLLADERVTLRDRPAADGTGTGRVPDGTLARVEEVRGTWLRIRTVEGPPTRGWLDDFFLRGGVHLVGPPPTCSVPFDGGTLPAGEQAVVLDLRAARVKVRINRTGATDWVDRTVVREIPPDRCAPIGRDEPVGDHEHHH
ncbi:SH3 domain-containing protein [Micromonospora sp. R77]|uniref:SH3 domain-containing protein n=1 Tax=Micromonospora sp. R77 TaxID=2925836 RepID=UPI001F614C99|nr:SH3 domain-containing protein [Micromonospora sp. R77]MCI4062101.1 SH3 domain-containing protein [Micromonospora sp. R77]